MARDLEGIRDRLMVTGPDRHDRCGVYKRDDGTAWEGEAIGTFPREDEAWGVVSLILEYVDAGQDEKRACDRALREYRDLLAGEDNDRARYADLLASVGPDLDDDSRRYQDHQAQMGVLA